MSSPELRVSVEDLRDAARERVAETSLRVAAKQIGLSWAGLRTFLAGTNPYGPTLVKLRAWYEREHTESELFRIKRENAILKRRVAELEQQLIDRER